MPAGEKSTRECPVCHQQRRTTEFTPGDLVREPLVVVIQRVAPQWTVAETICWKCLNRFRAEHVRHLLEEEKGELSSLEEEVIRSLREQDSISENVEAEFDQRLTLGERMSDGLAAFGGSWTFLILFAVAMVIWIGINVLVMATRPFDPYPFILLNLILSCLAAVQAPIIMMSQNRQEAKDRLRSQHDYRVNLKAEIEIRLLHSKLDQLLTHQWQRLLEIQQVQTELLQDALGRGSHKRPPAAGE